MECEAKITALLQFPIAPNNEMSEIAARLKAKKITRKKKKIFQNWYSIELIICTLRKSKKKPEETSHFVLFLKSKHCSIFGKLNKNYLQTQQTIGLEDVFNTSSA